MRFTPDEIWKNLQGAWPLQGRLLGHAVPSRLSSDEDIRLRLCEPHFLFLHIAHRTRPAPRFRSPAELLEILKTFLARLRGGEQNHWSKIAANKF
jgi:hypothetical protein